MRLVRLLLVGAVAVWTVALAGATPGWTAEKKKKPAAPAPAPAAAGKTRTLGTEGSWTAYEFQDMSGRVCYLVSPAQKSEPAGARRKPPSAMVTHRPEEKIANVVSFVEGYALKDGSEVSIDVGGAKFELFTKDGSAWARNAELDKTIVTALIKGRSAVVKGTPQHGAPTTDTYSLSGFSRALALIDKACGVKR